jgi:hypothetical protein
MWPRNPPIQEDQPVEYKKGERERGREKKLVKGKKMDDVVS